MCVQTLICFVYVCLFVHVQSCVLRYLYTWEEVWGHSQYLHSPWTWLGWAASSCPLSGNSEQLKEIKIHMRFDFTINTSEMEMFHVGCVCTWQPNLEAEVSMHKLHFTHINVRIYLMWAIVGLIKNSCQILVFIPLKSCVGLDEGCGVEGKPFAGRKRFHHILWKSLRKLKSVAKIMRGDWFVTLVVIVFFI